MKKNPVEWGMLKEIKMHEYPCVERDWLIARRNNECERCESCKKLNNKSRTT